jgi:hypothetical protein
VNTTHCTYCGKKLAWGKYRIYTDEAGTSTCSDACYEDQRRMRGYFNPTKKAPFYLIFFEGSDQVGKTTLQREFAQQLNQVHSCYDRGPGSCWVYDHLLRNKTDDETEHWIDLMLAYATIAPVLYVRVWKDDVEPNTDRLFDEFARRVRTKASIVGVPFFYHSYENDFSKTPAENAEILIGELQDWLLV